ncbi:hypothetical protein ABZX92_44470 [Lentzea sp. NPDC006480]|uniref:hypothetical protein n=1 Tax=Lentzea sp. NPDC006480 TaxID=3157176 RepID=UPI0033B8F8C1
MVRELLSRLSCDLPSGSFARCQDLLDAGQTPACALELLITAIDGTTTLTSSDFEMLAPLITGSMSTRHDNIRIEAPSYFSVHLAERLLDDATVRACAIEESIHTVRSGCRVDNATGLPIGRIYLLGYHEGTPEREIIEVTARVRRKIAVWSTCDYCVDGYVKAGALPAHYLDLCDLGSILWMRERVPQS